MASSRRPTYKPAGTGGRTRESRPTGIISAERAVEGTGRGAEATRKPTTAQQAGKKSPRRKGPQGPSESANVLSFPEPKGRKLKRTIIWTASIIAVLVAALIAGAVYSPVLAVRTIRVDGTKLLTPESVRSALAPVEGRPLPQVGPDEVSRLLKPLVQVRSATVEAHPPSELVVHIDERVPVALMKQGEQYQLVDVDGVQLATTADPASVALPLIDGGGATVGKELFAAITSVLATLPPDVLARMATASAKSVDSVELKLIDGKTVVWGNAEERELKAQVLEALLKAPANPKVAVSVYDVSTPRHAFTK